MTIGIDISQIVYEGTGVSRYVRELTTSLIQIEDNNTFVLFGSSLRNTHMFLAFVRSFTPDQQKRIRLITTRIPLRFLEVLWNRLHILPIEYFTGALDIFWSSDWVQPPLKNAKGITTIHDLTPIRFPETFAKKIITVHTRKLQRSIQECQTFLCDSEATKKDAHMLLGISNHQLEVVYPGFHSTL